MCSPLSEIVLHMYFTHHRVKYGGNACARRWLGELLPRPIYISQETFLNSDYFIFDGTVVLSYQFLYSTGVATLMISFRFLWVAFQQHPPKGGADARTRPL